MKEIYFYIGLVLFAFTSCEEVVDVDLNYSDDRLVIEGHLKRKYR